MSDDEALPPPAAAPNLAERLAAAGAPLHLPAAFKTPWLIISEAPPPIFEFAEILTDGARRKVAVLKACATALLTYAFALTPQLKDGSLHVVCNMPGCTRETSIKAVEGEKIAMGNIVKHFLSTKCPRALLAPKELALLKGSAEVPASGGGGGAGFKTPRAEELKRSKSEQLEVVARALAMSTVPFAIVNSPGWKYMSREFDIEPMTHVGVKGGFDRIYLREVQQPRAARIQRLAVMRIITLDDVEYTLSPNLGASADGWTANNGGGHMQSPTSSSCSTRSRRHWCATPLSLFDAQFLRRRLPAATPYPRPPSPQSDG